MAESAQDEDEDEDVDSTLGVKPVLDADDAGVCGLERSSFDLDGDWDSSPELPGVLRPVAGEALGDMAL